MSSIPPFGLPASRLPILGKPLSEAVAVELAAAGLSRPVTVADDVFVNAACLAAFASQAPAAGGRLVLRSPGYCRRAGGADPRELAVTVGDGRAPVELDAEEASYPMGGSRDAEAVAAKRVAVRIRSFSDLLWANLFAMTARVRNLSPAFGAWLVLRAALKARSFHPDRIGGKLVQRGRGCRIHPSAVVEASVLGERVTIGAGAVVKGSWLADGVEVEEQALVVGSVLGPGSKVLRQAMLKFSLLDRFALAGGTMQLCVFGEGASLRSGSYTLDRRLDGTAVKVPTAEGALVEAGPELGCALGPGASVGSGIWIAPGRCIPAGAIVVRAESDTVTRVPEGLTPGVYAAAGGTLSRR